MIKIFKDGKEMSDTEFNIWIGEAVNTHLIAKLYRAGFSNEQIAEIGKIPISIVEKRIKYLKPNEELK